MAKVLVSRPGGASADLYTLSTNLRGNANGIRPAVRQVVRQGARRITKDWKRLYQASELHGHAPSYARAISWERDRHALAEIGVEVGPDKGRRQGALGNLIEFGSRNNAPQNEGGRSLAIEEPRYVSAMRAVARLDI